jgi:hypothetical protein
MTSYPGYIPPDTILYTGDYTTSPSGTYYGITSGGFFWIVPGTNPGVAPCCTYGESPLSGIGGVDLGGYFTWLEPDGNLAVFTSATGTNTGFTFPIYATNSAQSDGLTYFAQVLDNGGLQIVNGTGPQNILGSPIFTSTNQYGAVTKIDLTNVIYDFTNAKFTGITGIAAGYVDLANGLNVPAPGDGELNLSYSQSYSLSFAVADSVGESISATTTISLPGLAKEGLTIGISNQTTVTKGHADTTTSTVQWSAGFRPNVPALSTVRVAVSGVNASYEVPYDWTGVATYASGITANVSGTGLFKGSSEGNFQASVSCLISVLPSQCDPGASFGIPLEFSPVPEPGIAAVLALGLVATRLRRRR